MKITYTTEQVVNLTGINRRKLYLFKDMGLLNPIRIGKGYLWQHSEIENFLDWAKGLDLSNEATIKKSMAIKPFGRI